MKKIKARELLTRRMLDKEFKDTKEVSKMEYEVYPNDKEVRVENLWFRDEYDNERKAFSFLTFEQILVFGLGVMLGMLC